MACFGLVGGFIGCKTSPNTRHKWTEKLAGYQRNTEKLRGTRFHGGLHLLTGIAGPLGQLMMYLTSQKSGQDSRAPVSLMAAQLYRSKLASSGLESKQLT